MIKNLLFLTVLTLSLHAETRYNALQGTITKNKKGDFTLLLSDGKEMPVHIAEEVSVLSLGTEIPIIGNGERVFISGLHYEEQKSLTAENIVVIGKESMPFERDNWWSKQAHFVANFWIKAQFDACFLDKSLMPLDCDKKPLPFDASKYQTPITKGGFKRRGTSIQETAVLSRLIYGLSSNYLLNGDGGSLQAAKALVEYQRTHMRRTRKTNEASKNESSGEVYWIHAIVDGKPVVPSLSGDDKDTIPIYEQIYCLAGLTQYYRITNDQDVLSDIKQTMNFIDNNYLDIDNDGYFSHLEPATFDPTAKALGINQAKKNWNSIGDHIPAYLMNLYLATRDESYLKKLNHLGDLIVKHFPDQNSPFVFERFDQNWKPDLHYSWQQNRGVTGHDLKIAWCLTSLYELSGNPIFLKTAEKAADLMLTYGEDRERGGWYDVMRREKTLDRDVWHNRKSWWQQEQGILAYYMLYALTNNTAYLDAARRGSTFYNIAYLDKQDGGIYFSALATGLPYIDNGIRADKGSHSKGGYHALELAYYAENYTRLFIEKKPLTLHFQPNKGGTTLNIQPIPYPLDSVKLQSVTIDGKSHADFNPNMLNIKLPESDKPLKITCELTPSF